MECIKLHIPETKSDLLKLGAVRIAFCAVPYCLLARLWSDDQGGRPFHGWWFVWCVVAVPVAGPVLEVWRLKQTRDRETRRVEPTSGANAPPAEQRDQRDCLNRRRQFDTLSRLAGSGRCLVTAAPTSESDSGENPRPSSLPMAAFVGSFIIGGFCLFRLAGLALWIYKIPTRTA